jgi:hypothetical protein
LTDIFVIIDKKKIKYCIYPAIKFAQKMLFNLIIKKDNGNPIDTSIVVPVRGVA